MESVMELNNTLQLWAQDIKYCLFALQLFLSTFDFSEGNHIILLICVGSQLIAYDFL